MPLSLLLLASAATWTGRLFAFASLIFSLVPALLCWGRKETSRWRARSACILLLIACMASLFLVFRAPTGSPGKLGRVQHSYSSPQNHFARFALGNILPEVDQLMLGYSLALFLDPLLTASQASELRRATKTIYRELEADPDFHALGSVMPDAYLSLIGGQSDRGHAYVLLPRAVDPTKPLRTIVFLHGTGGNFKGYLWVLAELADRCHAVVIAPSYGMGDWGSADVMTIIQRAMETIGSKVQIDSADVHVIGLSNGGLGVSQLLHAPPGRFRSLVFLSPVFDRRELDRLSRVRLAKQPPIFVLSGDRDDRIPPSYVEESVRLIRSRSASASPTVRFIDGADHFAIFARRREVIAALSEWLEQQR